MSNALSTTPISRLGDPPGEIAQIFPEQGYWDEGDYLALPTKRLVEFDNGMIEVLPWPKKYHQLIMQLLYDLFRAYMAAKSLGGIVLVAGYKLRIPSRKYREPDVMYLTTEQEGQSNDDFASSAEWVVEVVRPDDPARDYVKKREDYALARVPEYWIVDRDQEKILVLRLEGDAYVDDGSYSAGERAVSHRFPGFGVAVDDILKIGR